MTARAYWETEFTSNWHWHSEQNRLIAATFFEFVTGTGDHTYLKFRHALEQDHIIEVGCGTGELTARIAWAFHTKHLHGVDLSQAALDAARRRYPLLDFAVYDLLNDEPSMGFHWQLAVCSNVLEHFADPHPMVERLLTIADQALILVPYRQPVTDESEIEGGPGHLSTFTKSTFKRYTVQESVVFESPGWSYSSKGEKPQQLAVLLETK